MKYIGAHVSIKGGVWEAPGRAAEIGATAFAMFTKNQRQWRARDFTEEDVARFRAACEEHGYGPDHILPHDSYLINLGHPDADKLRKSRRAFVDEMQRCSQLGLSMLNFHPGSHLNGCSEQECLMTVAESVNQALAETEGVTAVLETTAGQGTNIGYCFEHLAAVMAGVLDHSRFGVCIDTCHIFTAGYDLRTPEACEATFEKFDRLVGFDLLRGVHLNDSKKALGSAVDRHECVGEGMIGMECFRYIMNDGRFDGITLVLETPNSDNWAEELTLLRAMVEEKD